MELVKQKSPLVRSENSHLFKTFIYLGGLVAVLIASLLIRVFTVEAPDGVYSNIGVFTVGNILLVSLASMGTAVVVEYLYNLSNKEKHKLSSYLNSIAIGLTIALLLPLATRIYPAIVATVVAVYLGKLIYGGEGHSVFNPAAMGVCFAAISWLSGAVNKIADFIGAEYPLTSIANLISGEGSSIALSSAKLLVGTYSDVAIGVSSALVLGVILAIFIATKVSDWKLSVTYIVSCALITVLALAMNGWKIGEVGGFEFLIANLCSGMLMFVATFLFCDTGSTPSVREAKFIIATLVAVMTMAIRFVGTYTEANLYILHCGELFALLIGNMLSPLINSIYTKSNKKTLLVSLGVCVLLVVAAGLGFGGAL